VGGEPSDEADHDAGLPSRWISALLIVVHLWDAARRGQVGSVLRDAEKSHGN
jgi:hypothetical protein